MLWGSVYQTTWMGASIDPAGVKQPSAKNPSRRGTRLAEGAKSIAVPSPLDVEVDPNRRPVRLDLRAVEIHLEFPHPRPPDPPHGLRGFRDRVRGGLREALRRGPDDVDDLLDHPIHPWGDGGAGTCSLRS